MGAGRAPGALGEAVEDGDDAGVGAPKATAGQRDEDGVKADEKGEAKEEGEEDGFQAFAKRNQGMRRLVVRGGDRGLPCPCHGWGYTPSIGGWQELVKKFFALSRPGMRRARMAGRLPKH